MCAFKHTRVHVSKRLTLPFFSMTKTVPVSNGTGSFRFFRHSIFVLGVVQATSKLPVLKWNPPDRNFRVLHRRWQLNAKNQTRQLLAFPWTGPNVQAKCRVMKAATSISEKEAAHSLAKHAILPIRTFVPYSEEIPTLHGSTWSQKYSTAMYNWNQKYSCLKDLDRLSLDVKQYYTRRTPPEAPAPQDFASTTG